MHDFAKVSSPNVIIAGRGATTAVGVGVEALRAAMRSNRSGLRKCNRFSGDRFQSNIAGAALQNGEGHDDPAYELAHQALNEACREAQTVLHSVTPGRLGFVLATTKANIEALERFIREEPLRRVHECCFGVLALESEPVDPRL